MATVNYTIRLDESDKLAAEQVFNKLGLTLAAGLNVYLKAVARQQKIPFSLALNENTATTMEQTMPDEDVMRTSRRIMAKNKDAYEVLAQ